MIEHLTQPSPAELDALTALWEASVRATHDFLSEEDIPFFRQMVRNEALPAVDLYVTRDTGDRTDGTDGPGGQTGTGIDRDRPNGETGQRQPGKRVRRNSPPLQASQAICSKCCSSPPECGARDSAGNS